MAADGFQGGKPELTIASLGDTGHGKTTMASALVRMLSQATGAQAGEATDGTSMRRFGYETSRRRYRHLDCPADEVPGLLRTQTLDGAILVVSALDSVTSQTREHVRLARTAGVPLVVLHNKCDSVEDQELLDLNEVEIRTLLTQHGYDGDNARIVRGSAYETARGNGVWHSMFVALVEALDEDLPQGQPKTELPARARLVAKHSGKVLDVAGGAATNGNGARIHQWEWKGGDNQKWSINAAGDGYYYLVAKHSTRVLDVSGGPDETRNGARVHQWSWVNGDNQKWRIEPVGDGYHRLVAKHSGKVLDVDGGAAKNDNGAIVQQWDWVGWDNQMWRLEPIQDSDW
ncbi:RICIN domain-containing protein [Streptomyces sp. NPDC003032]